MNLLQYFDEFQKKFPAPHRSVAFEFLKEQGLPTRRNEDWKYTSLKVLSEKSFHPFLGVESDLDQVEEIRAHLAPFAWHIVFVNGVFRPDISSTLPKDFVMNEAEAQAEAPKDGLDALNAIYSPHAYQIQIPGKSVSEKPYQLLFWNTGKMNLSSPQVFIQVGPASKVSFIEDHAGAVDQEYFSNAMIQVAVQPQAHLSWLKVQEESQSAIHIGRTHIDVARDCVVDHLVFSTGARLARNTLEVMMKGEGATATVNGIYATTGSQHVDNNTTIDHQVGHCQTDQLYKGLLDGESRAVFNGKVLIQRYAQKANSNQLNNNLLLSGRAEVDTKPMLQIDADDVKATHGSTVGQLNKEELFYMLSRGISKKNAISLLSYGFLSEVIQKLPDEKSRRWLSQKLDRAFDKLHLESL